MGRDAGFRGGSGVEVELAVGGLGWGEVRGFREGTEWGFGGGVRGASTIYI